MAPDFKVFGLELSFSCFRFFSGVLAENWIQQVCGVFWFKVERMLELSLEYYILLNPIY